MKQRKLMLFDVAKTSTALILGNYTKVTKPTFQVQMIINLIPGINELPDYNEKRQKNWYFWNKEQLKEGSAKKKNLELENTAQEAPI